ncbi:MAG: DUF4286 family protein [Cytophagales bacterium]
MIVYNTTFNVAPNYEIPFLEFLEQEYILDSLNTKLLHTPKFMRLLGNIPDEGSTYSLQFNCNDIESYLKFEENFAGELQDGISAKFGENVLFFCSVLEVLF